MEDMAEQLKGMFSQLGQGRRKTRRLKIAEALKLLVDEEAASFVTGIVIPVDGGFMAYSGV